MHPQILTIEEEYVNKLECSDKSVNECCQENVKITKKTYFFSVFSCFSVVIMV